MAHIASDYFFALMALCEAEGFSPTQACEECGAQVPRDTMTALGNAYLLARYLEAHTGLSHVGMRLGNTMGLHQHGLLGYAAKTSRNVTQAILVDEKFLASRVDTLSMKILRRRHSLLIVFRCDGASEAERRFVIQLTLASFLRAHQELFPGEIFHGEVSTTLSPPEDMAPFTTTTTRWQFDQDIDAIALPTDLADRDLPTADLHLNEILVNQISLPVVGGDDADIDETVRLILSENPAEPPGLEEVAELLGLHSRTLKRKLAAAGTSYREILTTIRVTRARELLRDKRLKIEDVAYALGYQSPNSFKRLFKEWTGMTPGQAREE